MTEIDPYEEYHGPATPRGFCPLCLSPERKGGMRAGSNIPFECNTVAQVTGGRADGMVYYRNTWSNITLGDQCFRNIVEKRSQ